VSGIFFSYAGKLVIHAIDHYLIHVVADNLVVVWTIHNTLTIIGNIVVAFGTFLRFNQISFTHV
jgi:hypothetical protein